MDTSHAEEATVYERTRIADKERRRERRNATMRNARKHRDRAVEMFGAREDVPLGQFKKVHSGGCHKSRCGLCSRHKRYGHVPTIQERKNELLEEEVDEWTCL